MSQPARLLVVLLLGLTQLGCSDHGENTGAPAEKAQAQAAQGKLSAAVIELKNALQKNPQDAQARFALAELYLKQERPWARPCCSATTTSECWSWSVRPP